MNAIQRNNVQIRGQGSHTMVFAHGFGCDLNMWRALAPSFDDRFKVVLFDLVGCGRSDLSACDRDKYGSLQGYADDLLEVIDATGGGSVDVTSTATDGTRFTVHLPQHGPAAPRPPSPPS